MFPPTMLVILFLSFLSLTNLSHSIRTIPLANCAMSFFNPDILVISSAESRMLVSISFSLFMKQNKLIMSNSFSVKCSSCFILVVILFISLSLSILFKEWIYIGKHESGLILYHFVFSSSTVLKTCTSIGFLDLILTWSIIAL